MPAATSMRKILRSYPADPVLSWPRQRGDHAVEQQGDRAALLQDGRRRVRSSPCSIERACASRPAPCPSARDRRRDRCLRRGADSSADARARRRRARSPAISIKPLAVSRNRLAPAFRQAVRSASRCACRRDRAAHARRDRRRHSHHSANRSDCAGFPSRAAHDWKSRKPGGPPPRSFPAWFR